MRIIKSELINVKSNEEEKVNVEQDAELQLIFSVVRLGF